MPRAEPPICFIRFKEVGTLAFGSMVHTDACLAEDGIKLVAMRRAANSEEMVRVPILISDCLYGGLVRQVLGSRHILMDQHVNLQASVVYLLVGNVARGLFV